MISTKPTFVLLLNNAKFFFQITVLTKAQTEINEVDSIIDQLVLKKAEWKIEEGLVL